MMVQSWFVGPQRGLGESVSYWDRVLRDGTLLVLSGSCKQCAIPPDLVSLLVKLDLAKQYSVPLCVSYDPQASILLVAGDRLYS